VCLATNLDIITTGLLLVTLIVLIIYTIATWLLRQETVRQTELKLRPYIILTPNEDDESLFSFENIGNGHALDVHIDILIIDTFFYHFDPCHLVRQGKKEKVVPNALSTGIETDERVMELDSMGLGFPYFIELDNKKDYPLKVHYENIEGKRYYTRLEVRVHEHRIIIKGSDKDKEPRS